MSTPKRRDRALSETEIALWAHVARSARPLPGKRAPEPKAPEMSAAKPAQPENKTASSAKGSTAKTLSAKTSSAKTLPPEQKKPALTSIAPLERKLKTQLKRGIQPIEAVIDLHGMRQDEAHVALHRFIWRAQGDGAKLVLVVTGKGAAGQAHSMFGGNDERGVLRRMVPHWLRLPDLRPMVVGFDEADQRHGGSGALYIRLRRLRDGVQ